MNFIYNKMIQGDEMKNRIQDLREDSDLRQVDVAEAIGITQRKYSYIETGVQQLTAKF